MPAQREGHAFAPLAMWLAGILVSISSLVHPNAAASSTLAAHAYDRTDNGEWAVAGAPSHDGYRGVAFVYHRSGREWVLDATLAPTVRGPFARFGGAVAIDGNTLVVGAPWDDGWKGAAYVYERTAGVWNLASRLAPTSAVGDRFGSQVSFADGVVSLGADGGAVARFHRSATGWTEAERLAAGSVPLAPGRTVEASLLETVAAADERRGVPNVVESPMVIDPPTFVRASDGTYEDRTEIRWAAVDAGTFLYKIYRRLASAPPSANVLIRVASQDDSLFADVTGTPGVAYTYCVSVLDMAMTEGATRCDDGSR